MSVDTEQMFLSRQQAAAAAGVSLDTIARAIQSGALHAKRTSGAGKYLISRDALAAWFDGLDDA